MALVSVPYLDAAEVRERISIGGPALSASDFPDPWVENAVAEVEDLVEGPEGCAVAFTPRETIETVQVSAPGGLHRLILKWPKVRSIVSITVDGTAWTDDRWTLDADTGIITFWSCAYGEIVITYQHGFDAPPAALLRATAIYVERLAATQRSRSNRDVKVGLTEGGSTVYVRPVPGTWQLTGWDDFDSIIARLPHFGTPGIA